MTIRKAIDTLKAIQKMAIDKDLIKHDDINMLLDFISPYARGGNKKFIILYCILSKSMTKTLENDEYCSLVNVIDEVISFLKMEKNVETFLSWSVLGFIGIVIILAILN